MDLPEAPAGCVGGRRARAVFVVGSHAPEQALRAFRVVHMAVVRLGWRSGFVAVNLEEEARTQASETLAALYGGHKRFDDPVAPEANPNAGPVGLIAREAYLCYQQLKGTPPELVIAHDHGALLFFCLEARRLGVAFAATRFVLLSSGGTLRDLYVGRRRVRGPSELALLAMEASSAAAADMMLVPSERTRRWLVDNHGARLDGTIVVVERTLRRTKPGAAAHGERVLVVTSDFPLLRNCAFLAACLVRDAALGGACDRILVFSGAEEPDAIAAYLAARIGRAGATPPLEVRGGAFSADACGGPVTIFAPFGADHAASDEMLAALEMGAAVLVTEQHHLAEELDAFAIRAPASPDSVLRLLAAPPRGDGPAARRAQAREAEVVRQRLELLTAQPRAARDDLPERPRLSVAILHFNRPALLRQALESCLCQSVPPDEIIVVDDGSFAPDAIEALAEIEAAASTVTLRVLRQPNRYLGAARNAAVAAAASEFVFLLDDDNVLRGDAFERILDAQRHSDADFIGCFCDTFVGAEPPDAAAMRSRSLYLGVDAGYALFRNALMDGNALYRRSAFLALGGNSEDYGVGKDDQEFFARALQESYRLAVLPEAILLKRVSARRLKDLHYSSDAGHLRVAKAYWPALPAPLRPLLLAFQHEAEERFAELSSTTRWIDGVTGLTCAGAAGEIVGIYRDRMLAWYSTDVFGAGARNAEEVVVTADGIVVMDGRTGGAGDVFPARLEACSIGIALDAIRAAVPAGAGRAVTIEIAGKHGAAPILRATIRPPRARETRRHLGNVESRRELALRGWARRQDAPETPLLLSIFVAGRFYRQVAADLPRKVKRYGDDVVPYGFFVPLEQEAIDDPLETGCPIEVIVAETGLALGAAPTRVIDGRVQVIRDGAEDDHGGGRT